MSIKATSYLADPVQEALPLTLSITATVKEWRELMRAMPSDASAAGQLGMIISRSVGSSVAKLASRYDVDAWSDALLSEDSAA